MRRWCIWRLAPRHCRQRPDHSPKAPRRHNPASARSSAIWKRSSQGSVPAPCRRVERRRCAPQQYPACPFCQQWSRIGTDRVPSHPYPGIEDSLVSIVFGLMPHGRPPSAQIAPHAFQPQPGSSSSEHPDPPGMKRRACSSSGFLRSSVLDGLYAQKRAAIVIREQVKQAVRALANLADALPQRQQQRLPPAW